MNETHRKLTVSKVQRKKDQIQLSFSDSSVGITIRKNWLWAKGIDPAEIVKGSTVYVKGKGSNGNEDQMLVRPDSLDNLRLFQTEIIVKKRSTDYQAFFAGHPEVWGCGKTPRDAIGDLICLNAETFDIEVKYV